MITQKRSRVEVMRWLDVFWRGSFWSGSAEVTQIPDRLHTGAIPASFALAPAVAAAASAVAGVRGDDSLSRTP